MRVAIDKNINIKDLPKYEYICVFAEEPLQELLKTNLHCIQKDCVKNIDINLTNFDILFSSLLFSTSFIKAGNGLIT